MNVYINFVLLEVIKKNNEIEYFFPHLYKHLLCSVGLLTKYMNYACPNIKHDCPLTYLNFILASLY